MPTQGSPPRVRGKVFFSAAHCSTDGITPACAGKRGSTSRKRAIGRDHPRMCGEKVCVYRHKSRAEGSPPHVRGKGRRTVGEQGMTGITPACAGKSPEPWPRLSPSRDHPRMCGEKDLIPLNQARFLGSPPHVRGKVYYNSVGKINLGITPACAGKRNYPYVYRLCRWDHPRMCGEKSVKISPPWNIMGSPPHVRGKA